MNLVIYMIKKYQLMTDRTPRLAAARTLKPTLAIRFRQRFSSLFLISLIVFRILLMNSVIVLHGSRPTYSFRARIAQKFSIGLNWGTFGGFSSLGKNLIFFFCSNQSPSWHNVMMPNLAKIHNYH